MQTVSDPITNARQRAAEALKKLPWLTEAQAALGWGIILILIALLGAIYLSQTSRIAIVGRRVQLLQEDLDNLKRQNAEIETDIAAAQSLERLEVEARQLGFVPAQADNIEYLVVPGYPADAAAKENGSGPPPDTPPRNPPHSMSEALWLLVKAEFGNLVQGESGE